MMERMAVRASAPTRKAAGAIPPAPPLTVTERRAILIIVVIGVVAGTVLAFTRDSVDVAQAVFEIAVTASFAGFLASPPVTVAALGASMGVAVAVGSSTEMLLALAVATGLAARTATVRLLFIFTGVLLVAAAAAILTAVADQVTTIVVYLLLATVSGAIGFLFRFSRGREERLRDELVRREIAEHDIRQSERLLIADELHDVVSRDLTVLVMQTELMSLESDAEALRTSQATVRDAARQALRDLHRVVSRVSDERDPFSPMADPLDLALDEARRDLEKAGFPLTIAVSSEAAALPQIVDTTLARTVRETTTNVLKHAESGPVSILIEVVNGFAMLEVRNRVGRRRPLSSLPSSGYGGIRMRERATLLGGTFTFGRDGREWVARARLPIA